MLKTTTDAMERLDRDYDGIKEEILRFEFAALPDCPHCQSDDTAAVQVGIIQRSINFAVSTTRLKLIPNGPKPGDYFCVGCERFFTP